MRTPLVFPLCALCALGLAREAHGQAAPVPPRDVVILAMGSDDGLGLDLLRQTRQVFGSGDGNSLDTMRDVQMAIVKATAPFGPVLLLAPDDQVRSEITERCDAYELCDFIAKGVVRIAIVPHDTPWIRDYGPAIDIGPGGKATVTDAVYDNARRADGVAGELRRVNDLRRILLKDAQIVGPEAMQSSGRSLEDTQAELALLGQYAETLRDEAVARDRPQDDDAAFGIAQAVLLDSVRTPSQLVQSEKIFLDGGNLLKTEDGACLTTTALYSANPRTESEVPARLKAAYGCRETIPLEALPGRDVIRHVDMFVLPARGRKLLLADFGLDQPHVKAAWPAMSALERELTFQAAIAMHKNEATLRSRGYDVVFVPAPLPRRVDESHVYYPTVMNALVRSDGKGRLQVILPSYSGFQEDVQKMAQQKIAETFGEGTEIVTVESTVAARGQGAVHCLTITAPFDVSVFNDGQETAHRQMWALRESLNESLVQITRPTLIGRWASVPTGGADVFAASGRWQVTFDDHEVTMVFRDKSITAAYTASKEHRFKWPIELTFDGGQRKTRGRIDWLTDSSMRLLLENADPILLARELSLEELETKERRLVADASENGFLGGLDERLEGRFVQAWSMQGRAGEVVTLKAASDEFDTELLVIGPGFDKPLYNDDDDADDTQNSRLVVEFPQTGVYRVIVRSFERDEGGAFTLTAIAGDRSLEASLTSIPIEDRRLRVGSAVTGRLTTADVREEWGPVQAWGLSGCQGRKVRVDLASAQFDARLIVTGPGLDGPLINDDVGPTLDSSLEFDCTEGGSYTVFVNTAVESETGEFRLSARVADPR